MAERDELIEQATQKLLHTWLEHAELGTKASPEEHCRRLAQTLADDGLLATPPTAVEIAAGDQLTRQLRDAGIHIDSCEHMEMPSPCSRCGKVQELNDFGSHPDTNELVCDDCWRSDDG